MNLTEPIPYASGDPRPPRPEGWDRGGRGCGAAVLSALVLVVLLVGALFGVSLAWLLWGSV